MTEASFYGREIEEIMIEFENCKVYWCISPKAKWEDNFPEVKPWQGELHFNRSDMGVVWTMHPVDSLEHHWSLNNVYIYKKGHLFHTEKEASYAYYVIEKKRLQVLVDILKEEIKNLVNFVKEKL